MPTVEVSPHSRAFGVEIEFGIPNKEKYNVKDSSGYEYFDRQMYLSLFGFNNSWRNPEGWSAGEDGSLFEFRSPILQGKAGFKELRRMMKLIKENDGHVTSEDGLHVHHDAPEFVNSPERTLALVRSWTKNIEAIHEMVHPRRHKSWACPGWDSTNYQRLEQGRLEDLSWHGDRPDLNIFALKEHGTVEFRLHEGTLDIDAAEAWVKFGQRFIYEVLKQTAGVKVCSSDVELMSHLKLSPTAMAAIAAKKARGHLDAA